MVGLTTVALIERRPDITRSLFSRYWRDVHGVMAARIPGFDSYTQYHVTPVGPAPPFEGIALVTFVDEAHRAGLGSSEVTRHIHRDEQNVFRRALLYNLTVGASVTLVEGAPGVRELFFVVAAGADTLNFQAEMGQHGPTFLTRYDLRTGDPAAWNDTAASDVRFETLLHAGFADNAAWCAALSLAGEGIGAYQVDERYVMMENGYPTALGLRGFDAVRTIEEVGATNQLDPAVIRAVYGSALAP